VRRPGDEEEGQPLNRPTEEQRLRTHEEEEKEEFQF